MHTTVETQPRSRLEKQCLATAIENRDKTCLETLSLAYQRSWRIAAKCLKEGSSWSVLLNPVYTIQPVVKRVWQPAVSCKQTSKQLSNRLSNRHCSFNRVERTATVRSTGCQTGLYNRFDNRLYTRYSRFVKPVVKRVWQAVECLYTRYNRLSTVVSCIQAFTGLTTGFIV